MHVFMITGNAKTVKPYSWALDSAIARFAGHFEKMLIFYKRKKAQNIIDIIIHICYSTL